MTHIEDIRNDDIMIMLDQQGLTSLQVIIQKGEVYLFLMQTQASKDPEQSVNCQRCSTALSKYARDYGVLTIRQSAYIRLHPSKIYMSSW